MVRSPAGMPSRMSSLGSGRGGTCDVRIRLSRLMASSLTGSSASDAERRPAATPSRRWRVAYDSRLATPSGDDDRDGAEVAERRVLEDESRQTLADASADSRHPLRARSGRARSGSSRRDGGDRAPARCAPLPRRARPHASRHVRLRAAWRAWRAPRPSADSDRASESPSARRRQPDRLRRICSTRLTRSKNSGQSIDDSSRMLVMMLPMPS